MGLEQLVVVLVYLPYDLLVHPPNLDLESLVSYYGDKGLKLIIRCASKPHHEV